MCYPRSPPTLFISIVRNFFGDFGMPTIENRCQKKFIFKHTMRTNDGK